MNINTKSILKDIIVLGIAFITIFLFALFINTEAVTAKESKEEKAGSATQIQSVMQEEAHKVNKKIATREIKLREEAEKIERQTQSKREDLLSYAKKFIGNPYVLGGRSLTNGCDCASFVTLIYKNFGYNWQLGSVTTLINNCGGKEVSISELKEGDIIFFGNMSHVAIYSGNGKIVHAMDEGNGITETTLFPNGGNVTYCGIRINTIRRIL